MIIIAQFLGLLKVKMVRKTIHQINILNWFHEIFVVFIIRPDTVCPRSSDPFYIVSYYKNGALLLGHTVCIQTNGNWT